MSKGRLGAAFFNGSVVSSRLSRTFETIGNAYLSNE